MKKIIYWLPTLAWMFVIFSFSAQPALRASEINWQDYIIRKFAHVAEYFVLTILVHFSVSRSTGIKTQKSLNIAAIISLLYAITDELHQTTVPFRQGKFSDVIIDSFGILLAWLWVKVAKYSRIV